jgi:hypothetical protein
VEDYEFKSSVDYSGTLSQTTTTKQNITTTTKKNPKKKTYKPVQ